LLKRTSATTLLVVVSVLCGPVLAAPQSQGPVNGAVVSELLEKLHRHDSVHFTLYTDYEDDEHVNRLLGDLEKSFSRLQKEFWDYIPPAHREGHSEVVIFQDRAAFDEFGQRDSGIAHGRMGWLGAKSGRVGIFRQDEYYKDLTIAVHELTHVFNSWCASYTPVWLDEGMAQYYANFAAEGAGYKGIRNGISINSLKITNTAMKKGAFVPLAGLMRINEDVFYGPSSRVNFAEAWGLVFYLRHGAGANAESAFSDFYGRLARGAEAHIALTGAYGTDFEKIERFWIAYLQRLYGESLRAFEGAVSENNAAQSHKTRAGR